ncbi:MAG: hypothetical protein ACNYZH_05390 [Acidimicrobiia bacterium]
MSRMMTLTILLVVGLVLGATACDSGSSDTTETTGDSTAITAVPPSSSTTTTAGEATTTIIASEEATTTTAVVEAPEFFLPGVDVPEITQLTPTTGVGGRPLLEWSGYEAASAYELTVFGAGGTIYWSSVGPESSIYLGGAPASDQSPGPQVQDGMSWAVVALDVDGNVIAQSRVRPINP